MVCQVWLQVFNHTNTIFTVEHVAQYISIQMFLSPLARMPISLDLSSHFLVIHTSIEMFSPGRGPVDTEVQQTQLYTSYFSADHPFGFPCCSQASWVVKMLLPLLLL